MLWPATVIATPDAIAVVRFLRRHHTPCVVIVAGSESMKPVQLSKLSAARTLVAEIRPQAAAKTAAMARERVAVVVIVGSWKGTGGPRDAGSNPVFIPSVAVRRRDPPTLSRHIPRSAVVTGMRAARIAGSRPP